VLTGVVAITSYLAMKSTESFNIGGKLPDDFQVNEAKDVVFTQIDKDGKVKYVLHAQDSLRYADGKGDISDVKLLTYSDDQNNPWHITAKKAQILNDNTKIFLSGGVVITRDADGKKVPPIKITTESGSVFPKRNYVESSDLVTMTEPGSNNIMTGVGLKGYLNPTNLTLLSNVRTYYVGNPQE
jgi:LPS export ABC transporter protein LptC